MVRDVLCGLAALAVGGFVSGFAGVVVVGPTPGQPDVIQQAIAAAAPGDTIIVQPGFYQHSAPIEIDKSLTLIGYGPTLSAYVALPVGPTTDAIPLHIHDIDASEEVRVIGMQFSASPWDPAGTGIGSGGEVVVIEDCVGPVSLAGVEAFSNGIVTGPLALVQVRNAQQVVFDRSTMSVSMAGDVVPIPALRSDNSTVWVNECFVRGGTGLSGFATGALHGGAGIELVASTLRVSRSDVRGGAGGQASGFSGSVPASLGGTGIVAVSSSIEVAGGPGGIVQGGTGGLGFPGGVGAGGSGVTVSATSFVHIAADALVLGNWSGDFGQQAPDVSGAGSQLISSQRFASLELSFSVVALGGNQNLFVAGEPGGVAVVGYSLGQAAAVPSPTGPGALCLDLTGMTLVAVKTLDFTGSTVIPRPIPASPGLLGVSVTAQAAVFDASLNVSYSAPVVMGLL